MKRTARSWKGRSAVLLAAVITLSGFSPAQEIGAAHPETGLRPSSPIPFMGKPERRLTFRADHPPLREVLDQIGKLADVRFLYEAGVVDPVKDVSVDCRNQRLYPTLAYLLRPHGLTCVVAMQGQPVITRLHEGPAEQPGSLKGVSARRRVSSSWVPRSC